MSLEHNKIDTRTVEEINTIFSAINHIFGQEHQNINPTFTTEVYYDEST